MTARTLVNLSLFLDPDTRPSVAGPAHNVWVILDDDPATGASSTTVWPRTPEQADALAAAFTEAAARMREATQ